MENSGVSIHFLAGNFQSTHFIIALRGTTERFFRTFTLTAFPNGTAPRINATWWFFLSLLPVSTGSSEVVHLVHLVCTDEGSFVLKPPIHCRAKLAKLSNFALQCIGGFNTQLPSSNDGDL
jgi:hypothetical protein